MTRTAIDLSGQWHCALDPEDDGLEGEWFDDPNRFDEPIQLPGTTDEAGLGETTADRPTHHLSRRNAYEGPVWYHRSVTIPEPWDGREIVLFVERARPATVWIDGQRVGSSESLVTPHEHPIPDLDPGRHDLILRVDNDAESLRTTGVQRSHMATDHTQTNWNGLLGELELRAAPPVSLDDVQAYPERGDEEWTVTIRADVANATGDDVDGTLSIRVREHHGLDAAGVDGMSSSLDATIPAGGDEVELECSFDGAGTWDEFDPTVYELVAEFDAGDVHDVRSVPVGLREFEADGTQFAVNGTTVFLRGNVDCAIFPRTGYPPMDASSWREYFRTLRRYGINHCRFHSWCPPEAAFEAADELGVYLQPELPLWDPETCFEDDEAFAYFRREAERILNAYGNHPSFVLFALGNELFGDRDRMAAIVEECRERDPRRLYAEGSNNWFTDPYLAPHDDFWVTYETGDPAESDVDVRGSYADHTRGYVNNEPPSTDRDYRAAIQDADVPVVSHEIGQYQAYPNFDERRKYTGVLEPRNLDVFAEHLGAHGMADQAADFHQATGELQVACYREEIEAALRTPGFGGFQLLDLQDFPGQGTALVGILDAFMDSKGFVEPERFREFCGPVVPLVRMERRTWWIEDGFEADVQIANYGPDDLETAVEWALRDGDRVVAEGTLDGRAEQGTLADAGTITCALDAVDAPANLTLTVSLPDREARNRYDVWVYEAPDDAVDDGPTIAASFSEAREALDDGEDVLLYPPLEDLQFSVTGAFQPDFWNYAHFKDYGNPGTEGLFLDPDHPAFDRFPTESHADWQWWNVLKNARPVQLDDMPDDYLSEQPRGYRPIAQVVDTPYRNRKLGLLFEVSALEGNLLVCAADLLGCDDPAATQLHRSLVAYAGSEEFDPAESVDVRLLEKLLA